MDGPALKWSGTSDEAAMTNYPWTAANLKYWAKTLEAHKITPEELSAVRGLLLVAQGWRCALCLTPIGNREGESRAFLDHDHKTHRIRGLLCMRCNRFIVASNTAETAKPLLEYLTAPPADQWVDVLISKVRNR
jgi:hypothetical protein